MIAYGTLQGLNFIHTDCKLVHTDLKPDNIMMAFSERERHEALDRAAREEEYNQLPRQQLGDRTICLSHNDFGLLKKGIGRPITTDFDTARPGDEAWSHEIQAHGYQTP